MSNTGFSIFTLEEVTFIECVLAKGFRMLANQLKIRETVHFFLRIADKNCDC